MHVLMPTHMPTRTPTRTPTHMPTHMPTQHAHRCCTQYQQSDTPTKRKGSRTNLVSRRAPPPPPSYRRFREPPVDEPDESKLSIHGKVDASLHTCHLALDT